MTRRQWGYTVSIMLMFFIPLFEISKVIIYYIERYDFPAYLLICEMVVYWIIWGSVIPVMRIAFRQGRRGPKMKY